MNRVPTYYGQEDEESEGVRTCINVSPLKPKTGSRAKQGVRFVKEPIVGTQSNANLRSKRAVAPSDNTPFKGVSNKTADDPNTRSAGLFTTAGSSWKNKTSNAQQETPSARSQFLSRRIKAREDLTPLVLPEISFRNSNTQNATSQSISTPLV